MSIRVIAIAAVAAVGIATHASADVLYDNLTATSSGTDSILGVGPLFDSFATGATGFALSQIDIAVSAVSPSDGGSFTVSIFTNEDFLASPAASGTLLDTVLDSSLTTSLSTIDLTFSTPYDLTADTTYWIELAAVGSTSAGWSSSADISGTGVAGQSYALNGGLVYPNAVAPGPFRMEVSGDPLSPVPEPASLALFGSGLIGFGWLRARQRKRA